MIDYYNNRLFTTSGFFFSSHFPSFAHISTYLSLIIWDICLLLVWLRSDRVGTTSLWSLPAFHTLWLCKWVYVILDILKKQKGKHSNFQFDFRINSNLSQVFSSARFVFAEVFQLHNHHKTKQGNRKIIGMKNEIDFAWYGFEISSLGKGVGDKG